MIDAAYPTPRPIRPRRSRGRLALLVPVLALGAAALPRLVASPDAPASAPAAERFVVVSDRTAPALPPPPRRQASGRPAPRLALPAALFEPTAVLGAATPTLAGSVRLTGDLVPAAPPPMLAAATPAAVPAAALPASRPKPAAPARLAEVPLPAPRPAELRPRPPVLAERPSLRRARIAARQEVEAERSFFDAVFGAKPPEPAAPEPEERPTALAYAATGRDAGLPPRGGGGLFEPRPEGGTATYDITARTVTLPSGEVLEAHSGLGRSQDNPRDVHIRMRGSTPPGTYAITEREALFHGVRALRLTPFGGSGAIHGRDGILAHTYMLGPSGASNGCVVFRNYDRFLQAYLRGEIRRLVVVAGSGDGLASGVARLFGRPGR